MVLLRAPWFPLVFLFSSGLALDDAHADPIRVLVWDEQQPKQKTVYPDFLGNQIAEHLAKRPELKVTTARLDDPEQGISSVALKKCDVLIWWGHVRHREISEAKGKEIVRRIESGELSMITLHSAHWSVPFREAMETKAAADALERLPRAERSRAKVSFLGERARKAPPAGARSVIKTEYRRQKDGSVEILLERPHCVFPRCCHPVEPSLMRTILPKHPIAAGIPPTFVIPDTEMYDEPFGVPEPDLVIFGETWKDGEWFRGGALWKIGAGKVFYFRPGHETYAVFFEEYPLKVLENAAVWLGAEILVKRGRSASEADGSK